MIIEKLFPCNNKNDTNKNSCMNEYAIDKSDLSC